MYTYVHMCLCILKEGLKKPVTYMTKHKPAGVGGRYCREGSAEVGWGMVTGGMWSVGVVRSGGIRCIYKGQDLLWISCHQTGTAVQTSVQASWFRLLPVNYSLREQLDFIILVECSPCIYKGPNSHLSSSSNHVTSLVSGPLLFLMIFCRVSKFRILSWLQMTVHCVWEPPFKPSHASLTHYFLLWL